MGTRVKTCFGALAMASVLWALVLAAPAGAATPAETAAIERAEALVTAAHGALASAEGDDAAAMAALQGPIDAAFAFDVWRRFLLKDREAAFTPAQQERFRALLPRYMARLYANNFGQGLAEPPEIGPARTVRRDVLVAAQIPRASGGPLPVSYRFRAFQDRGPLVVDVMVGGVSFLVLKRKEFGALIERGGAEALLGFMDAFVDAVVAGAP